MKAETELAKVPFSWNDPMAEQAQEAFDAVSGKLGYVEAQAIGMALAKLERIERVGRPEPCTMERDEWYPCAEDGCNRLHMPRWFCSKCEDDFFGAKPNYCPNCGAKVVE